MKIVILLTFILITACSKKTVDSNKHDVSSSSESGYAKTIEESTMSSLESIHKYEPAKLLSMASELLTKENVTDQEKTSSSGYKNKLKDLNGNLLSCADSNQECQAIVELYRKNVLCDNYAPDCDGHVLIRAGSFVQDVLIKILINDINHRDLSSTDLINAFYLAYEIIGIKEKNNIDLLFIKKYPKLRNTIKHDLKMKQVLDKRLWIITERIAGDNSAPKDLSQLVEVVKPWNHSNHSTDDMNKISHILFVSWMNQSPREEHFSEALKHDQLSIINQLQAIPNEILQNLTIESIKSNKCYYLLDRFFNGHISIDTARLVVSSMESEEKKSCLKDQMNYLKARMLTTIKRSNTQLMDVIQKIKKEKISNIKIMEVIESKTSGLKTDWNTELERFKSLEGLLFAEFNDLNNDDFKQLKLSFEGLGEKFQMYAQYPSMLALLYHFKDMTSSSVGMDLSIKETEISNHLEDLLLGKDWPVLDFGLSNYSVERKLNQTKIIHSFQSALLTGTFTDLQVSEIEMIQFILDKYPTREYKYLMDELNILKNQEINSKYKKVASFCENHSKNFLSQDTSNFKFRKNLSDLTSSILFDSDSAFSINRSYIHKIPQVMEIARLDYERKMRFGRILKDIYNQHAKGKRNYKVITDELYNSYAKKHLDIQKNVIKMNLDYQSKSYSCLNNLKKIEKIITKKVFSYEYLFLKEVHRQMTLLREGQVSLKQANEVALVGLSNVSKKSRNYISKDAFVYSKIAFLFRLRSYLTANSVVADKNLPPIASKMVIVNDLENIDEDDQMMMKEISYEENEDDFISKAMSILYARQAQVGFLNWWSQNDASYSLANKINNYLQLYRTNIHGTTISVDEKMIISEVLKNYSLLKIGEKVDQNDLSEKKLFQSVGLAMSSTVQSTIDTYGGVNINHFIDSKGIKIYNMFDGAASYFLRFAIGDTLISQQLLDEVQNVDASADASSIVKENFGNYQEGYNYFRDKNSMGPAILGGFEQVEEILDKEYIQLIKFDLDKIRNFHNTLQDEKVMNAMLEQYKLSDRKILLKVTGDESYYVPSELISDEVSDQLTDHTKELIDNILEVIKDSKLQELIK